MFNSATRAAVFTAAHRDRSVAELKAFLRFPSISAVPARRADVQACATWLARHLRQIGLPDVRIMPTAGAPVVYAEWCNAPGRPTVLVYGHYDVQPPGAASEWRTPPFSPVVRGGDLYARGSSDDKGQLFTHVKAIEAWLRTAGRLPVNVKCLFEGEEEVGSPHLGRFLKEHRTRLAADAAVVSDTAIPAPDRPALTYALRGGLAVELTVTGPARDLHSGHFGGAVHNPAQALAEILTTFHDRNGRIAIAGLYEDVRSVSSARRERLRAVSRADLQLLRTAGVRRGWGEPGFNLHERTTIRPALTINGISGGYAGSGTKSIVPARASAKISFRLVPDQTPDRVEELFRAHVARVTPSAVKSSVRRMSGSLPVVLDRRQPVFRAAAAGYWAGFGAAPVLVRSGGSIPVVNLFLTTLGVTTALMGFGLPDDRVHGPNEKFALDNFARGITASIHFLGALRAALPSERSGVSRPMP